MELRERGGGGSHELKNDLCHEKKKKRGSGYLGRGSVG